MAYTTADIQGYLAANPGMTDAQIASAMNQYGVTPEQMSAATGLSGSDVQSRYNVAQQANQNYTNLINQAYGSIGVTSPDAPGQQYWQSQLQSGAIRPEDFQRTFLSAASGVTDPAYASNVAKAQELLSGINSLAVSQAYQDVLGRAGDVSGSQYWANQLASGAIKPQDLAYNLAQAAVPIATGLEDRLALQKYLGKDIWAPEEYLKGTSGWGYKDIVDYINANIQDPVKIAQAAAQYGVDPAEILAAKQAVGGQDIPTLQAIEDYLAQGRAGFEPRFQQLVGSVFGSDQELTGLKNNLYNNFVSQVESLNIPAAQKQNIIDSKTPDSLFSDYVSSGDYSNKSIENIVSELQQSTVNKYQEAQNIAKFYQSIGLSSEDAGAIGRGLLSGESTNEQANKLFNSRLKGESAEDVTAELLKKAATENPDAPIFKQNPELLTIYRPLGELKTAGENQTAQYGYVNNAPILSASEANKLLGGNVFTGGPPNPITGEWNKDDSKLGWDLNSKYASAIANGAGLFGVTSNNQDINEFDRIEKQIAKSGGIRIANYGEGLEQVVDVERTDPETGQKFVTQLPLSSLFVSYDENGMPTGRGYQEYQKTLDSLQKGASQLGIDTSKYSSIKDLYNAVNDKSKDLYAVTGRANRWDPTVAAKQGITGAGQERGGVNHATVLYRQVGDKLVPVQTLKTFNFDDPNTSRGFFGDLATGIGEIMSIPPIQLALAMSGGLPNLFANLAGVEGGAATLASTLGSSVNSALGLELGKAGIANLGSALLNAGSSALTTGMMTGDLGKAGIAGLAGGIGAGIAGGIPLLDSVKDLNISPGALKLGSEIAGGAAATAITGQDPGAYAVNRLVSAGIGALVNMGAEKAGIPTKGPGAELFKAMLPIITSKKVEANDLVRLANAVKAYQTVG